ncbi:FAD:protein FMN transferase [Devosia rhodophyticola]|uniref:FAD:protein FMN transferase n=1 Tax=Devosia rhodophyticola TaxID=3026423 RepID=A0ABY7Z1M6_9HYPH|nr:FAD:protein FMN transferase [Devosia rhodophyticola]WDR07484.1 FAD:protein FMN transferase [Devosia rhodophyticola]
MGTRWSAIFMAHQDFLLASVQSDLQSAVDLVDHQMSTWKPDSDLMHFNRTPIGEWVTLPRQLFDVLALGLQIGEDSGGAFSVGVGAQVQAWGFGPTSTNPDTEAIYAARARRQDLDPEAPELQLDLATCRVRRNGELQLDLSGIAKGYGVDCLANCLGAHGIDNFLVSIDGEIRAGGPGPTDTGWTIGLERPVRDKRELVKSIDVSNVALATSGNYRHWREYGGAIVSHTIDPRIGEPLANAIASVTVAAATCAAADAWATALMVLGEEAGPAMARKFGLDAVFMLQGQQRLAAALPLRRHRSPDLKIG